ncbi:MAG: IPT/TIG domain-containing protein [Bryobacteraceae bacterium]
MLRTWLLLALLLANAAWGQAPVYSAASMVNGSNYAPGPFAPNSIVSIFGSGLAWSSQGVTAGDIVNNTLPVELNSTRVYVMDSPAPLLYVSDTQVNFLVPGNQLDGDVKIRVVREGVTGPEVTVTLVDAAPALFQTADGYAIAAHLDNSLIAPNSPAQAGEIIVLYACGLGRTQPNPAPGAIPQSAAVIQKLSDLKVYLGGTAIDPASILYAGLTPGSAGLYQINLVLPDNPGTDPEIRVAIADQSSPAGLKLAMP